MGVLKGDFDVATAAAAAARAFAVVFIEDSSAFGGGALGNLTLRGGILREVGDCGGVGCEADLLLGVVGVVVVVVEAVVAVEEDDFVDEAFGVLLKEEVRCNPRNL